MTPATDGESNPSENRSQLTRLRSRPSLKSDTAWFLSANGVLDDTALDGTPALLN